LHVGTSYSRSALPGDHSHAQPVAVPVLVGRLPLDASVCVRAENPNAGVPHNVCTLTKLRVYIMVSTFTNGRAGATLRGVSGFTSAFFFLFGSRCFRRGAKFVNPIFFPFTYRTFSLTQIILSYAYRLQPLSKGATKLSEARVRGYAAVPSVISIGLVIAMVLEAILFFLTSWNMI
jgi:hypothetical protein